MDDEIEDSSLMPSLTKEDVCTVHTTYAKDPAYRPANVKVKEWWYRERKTGVGSCETSRTHQTPISEKLKAYREQKIHSQDSVQRWYCKGNSTATKAVWAAECACKQMNTRTSTASQYSSYQLELYTSQRVLDLILETRSSTAMTYLLR